MSTKVIVYAPHLQHHVALETNPPSFHQGPIQPQSLAATANIALKNLYAGHGMNMSREMIFMTIYLGLYDMFKGAYFRHMESKGEGNVGDKVSDPLPPFPLPIAAAVSGLTGALAWFAAFPTDVVKTVQQARSSNQRPLSAPAAARRLWQVGGIRAFYVGAGAGTARAVLVTSSRLVAFEWFMWHR